MSIQIKTTKLVENVTFSDIIFPYYAWNYDGKQNHMIKLDVEYYSHIHEVSHIKCIELYNPIFSDPRITTKKITVANDIADEDLQYILVDFNIVTTADEFEKFKTQVLTKIFN